MESILSAGVSVWKSDEDSHAIRSVTRHGQAEGNQCIKSDNETPDLDAAKRPDIKIQAARSKKLDTVTTVTSGGELPRT